MRLAIQPENRHMTAFFALGIFGGLRPEEIQKMTWQKNIKMDSREIFISHDISKTKADRQFTM